MPVGRPIPSLTLTSEEKQTLERWSRRHRSAQALALRCRIVLACAEGLSNTAVARRLPATLQTVGKWRSRFLAQRLNGLLDEPRPGAPRKISDTAVEHVLTLTWNTTA
jgi:transposase